MSNKKNDYFNDKLPIVPNKKYEKFFDKFKEIDTLDISEWRIVHLLGYFCKKYKEAYNMDYPWKFNNESPNKCFEVWQANTLSAKLSANPKILKEYIDWVYLTKVVQAKRRLTSISFMTHDTIVNEYKFNVLLVGKKDLNVDRSTNLPDTYKKIFQSAGVKLETYGDLAFLSQMSEKTPEISDAFTQIVEWGFDQEILERII